MEKQRATIARKPTSRPMSALSLLLAASALAASLVGHTAQAGGLGTENQRAKEALALRLLASAPMLQAEQQLEALYRADPRAATSSGQQTLHRAAEGWAFNAAELAVMGDPDRPVAMWTTQAAHKWFGLDVPRASSAGDNPDNVYRYIAIDGAARYEIHGQIKHPGPSQETFDLDGPEPGSGNTVPEHVTAVSTLNSEQMSVAPDGSFTITVDSDPANGRPNHIQSRKDQSHDEILIRDTLSDWATQNPVALEVNRLSGPPLHPARTEAALAKRAAEILIENGKFWIDWEGKNLYTGPANQLPTPTVRRAKLVWSKLGDAALTAPAGGSDPTVWGLITIGVFDLADNEALVVTVKPLGAAYLGLEIADPWGPSLDYTNRNGSLNQYQAHPNADGTYTYVISAKDPGVYNWLDTLGLSSSKFFVRWQKFPAGVSADGLAAEAKPAVQVVKLQNLKDVLPPGTSFLTPDERKAQLATREATYKRRLEN